MARIEPCNHCRVISFRPVLIARCGWQSARVDAGVRGSGKDMEKIFWVDMEMTGLNPLEAVILEFAGIVTDLDLTVLDSFHEVVYQDRRELVKMNEWNRTTHAESGLLDAVPNGKPIEEVDERILAFLQPHFPDEEPILAGNSIHQDRKFIDRYMPRLSAFLHYRMIDVSSFKMVFKHMYGLTYKKDTPHRAFDDILASIEELSYYRQFIKVPAITDAKG